MPFYIVENQYSMFSMMKMEENLDQKLLLTETDKGKQIYKYRLLRPSDSIKQIKRIVPLFSIFQDSENNEARKKYCTRV